MTAGNVGAEIPQPFFPYLGIAARVSGARLQLFRVSIG